MEKSTNYMTTSHNTHGGKREGAGRKAHGGKRMMFRISDEAQTILDMVDDKSRFINHLIYKNMKMQVFADLINEADEWKLEFNEIIKANGWTDNTDTEFGICESATEILEYNDNAEAIVRAK